MNDELIQMFPAYDTGSAFTFLNWGTEAVLFFAQLELPLLTGLMTIISALGTQIVFVPVLLFITWLIDDRQGLKMSLLLIISAWLNLYMNSLFKQLLPLVPSPNTLLSLVFYVSLAGYLSKKYFKDHQGKMSFYPKPLLTVLLLLIAFSGLYLGLNNPFEIIYGWLLGGIILVIYFFAVPRLEKLFFSLERRIKNISAAALVLIMNALYPQGIALSALFLGSCLGYSINAGQESLQKKGGFLPCLIRITSGFLGAALLYFVLGLILPGEGSLFGNFPLWGASSPYNELGLFIHFCLFGLWFFAGAPLFFKRMDLSGLSKDSGEKH